MDNNSATAKAYEYLHKAIARGDYPPGTPLSEAELSQQLQISRSPIREALRKMEIEGIVKHYSNRGTIVSLFNKQDLEEIFQLRLLFELYAAEIAINRNYDELLAYIETEFIQAYENNDKKRFFAADAKLHGMIISYSGNTRLQKFMEMLDAQIRIVKTMSRKIEDLTSVSYEVHLGIIQALKDHDLELTKQRLREHIEQVEKRTLEEYSNLQVFTSIVS